MTPTSLQCIVEHAVLRCLIDTPGNAAASDVWKPLASTFIGAVLAFAAARMHDGARRRREKIAAGNLALFTLQEQLKDFTLFRRIFFSELARKNVETTPNWLLLAPSRQVFVAPLLDVVALTFLLERPGRGELFEMLYSCQGMSMDIRQASEAGNVILTEVLNEASKHASTAEAEAALGRYRIEAVEFTIREIGGRACSDFDQQIEKAFAQLRLALLVELDSRWRRWWRRRRGHIDAQRSGLPLIELRPMRESHKWVNLPRVSRRTLRRLMINPARPLPDDVQS